MTRRVISLLPAATEIVAALGAFEQLVGVTHECDYPEVVRSRARVTRSRIPDDGTPAEIHAAVSGTAHDSLFELLDEPIRVLHPDVLLTQALCDVCAINEGDVRALASRLTPQPVVLTLSGVTLEGVFEDIAAVGAALGVPDEATELLAGLRTRLRAVHETLKAARAPRPRMLLVEWTDPVFLAGHWAPEMVHKAGGIDALMAAGEHSHVTPMDALAASDPEIVVIAPCGYGLAAAEREARDLLSQAEWQWLNGRQVWAIDANGLVSRPGPRLVDGVEVLARIGNPGLFSPLDSHHAVRLT
jgi:iron complex transport system substrate-binding protein